MRKALSGIVTFIISVVFLSVIISFFMDDSFRTISIDLPKINRPPSKRVVDTHFSFPGNQSGVYDYAWLMAKAFPSRTENSSVFAAVDLQFYRSQAVSAISLDMASMRLLQPNGGFYATRLQDFQAYYSRLKIPSRDEIEKPVPLKISDVVAMPAMSGINYADNSDIVRNALFSQAFITETMSMHLSGIKNLVLPVSYIPASSVKNYGLNAARDVARTQIARNIFSALRKLNKEIPANTVRVLLSNHLDNESLQNKNTVALSLYLGLIPDELIKIRNEILNQNMYAGSPIANLGQKIGIALDTGMLVKVWQDAEFKILKDNMGNPISHEDLTGVLQKLFTSVDREGNVRERLVKVLYTSYYLSSAEARTGQASVHIPYFRASTTRQAHIQLKLFTDIFEMSDIGLEPDSAVVHYLPPRETFPILHRVAKPLAKRFHFYQKADGADRSEQKRQIALLKEQLNLYVR